MGFRYPFKIMLPSKKPCAALLFASISLVHFFNLGCATIIGAYSDPSSRMKFTSEPTGAKVVTDSYGSCITPCDLMIEDHRDFHITVTANGHETLSYSSETSFNYLTLLNLFFGSLGFFGMGVDYFNDQFFTLDDEDLFFELKPEGEGDSDDDEKSSPAGVGLDKVPKNSGKTTGDPAATIPQRPEQSQPELKKEPSPKAVGPIRPLSSSEKKRLAERYAPQDIHERVAQYYGHLSTQDLRVYEDRIYQQLKLMEDQGEAMDLDEAVRRDWFLHQGKRKKTP